MSRHFVGVESVTVAGRECFKVWTVCESAAEASHVQSLLVDRKPARAFVGAEFPADEPEWPSDANAATYPPNCETGAYAGEVLAQAQYEAATSGEDCTGTACLITRGSD